MNLELLGGRIEVLDLRTCPGVEPTKEIYPFLENDQYFEIKILTIHPVYTPQKNLVAIFL